MKKYFHFWTDDPYNLLNLLAQIYYEKNIDSNEAYTESTAYAFGDMLYQEEYQLNQEEWVDICKKYQKVHNQSGNFLIGENDDQGHISVNKFSRWNALKNGNYTTTYVDIANLNILFTMCHKKRFILAI